MKIWFDTEFIDDGNRLTLISIGMVREDDEQLYLELETPETLKHLEVSEWIKANVFPHLQGCVLSRYVAAESVRSFAGDEPEFWAYVADYDWVALSQLYGPLINRPVGWPWTALDTYQLPNFKKYVTTEAMRPAHHALADAANLKLSWLRWREAYPDFHLPTFSTPRPR